MNGTMAKCTDATKLDKMIYPIIALSYISSERHTSRQCAAIVCVFFVLSIGQPAERYRIWLAALPTVLGVLCQWHRSTRHWLLLGSYVAALLVLRWCCAATRAPRALSHCRAHIASLRQAASHFICRLTSFLCLAACFIPLVKCELNRHGAQV